MQKKKFVPGNHKHREVEKETTNVENVQSDEIPYIHNDVVEPRKMLADNRTLKLVGKDSPKTKKIGLFTVDLFDDKNKPVGSISWKQPKLKRSNIVLDLELNIDGKQSTLTIQNPYDNVTKEPLSLNVVKAHPILAKYPKERNLTVFSWNTTYQKDDENTISWDTSALDPSFTSLKVKQTIVMDGPEVVKCLNASYVFSSM